MTSHVASRPVKRVISGLRMQGALLCALLTFLICWTPDAWPADPGTPRFTLSGHVLEALSRAALLPTRTTAEGELSALAAPVTITVVLRRSDEAGVQQLVNDLYDRQSPKYRKFLTPKEVSDQFGPSQDDYATVQAYFEQQGFSIVEGSANRMTLTMIGTRGQAESSLAVNIKDYSIEGKNFYANDTDPSLPLEIAQRVEAVVGLNSLASPRPLTKAINEAFCNATAWVSSWTLVTDKDGKSLYGAVYQQSKSLYDKAFFNCMVDRNADGYAG